MSTARHSLSTTRSICSSVTTNGGATIRPIAVRAVHADRFVENDPLHEKRPIQPFRDFFRAWERRKGLPVFDELNPPHHAEAADVYDVRRWSLGQRPAPSCGWQTGLSGKTGSQ